MRKVEEKMIEAIKNRETVKVGDNTYVDSSVSLQEDMLGLTDVYNYGEVLVRINHRKHTIAIYPMYSKTSLSRLRVILSIYDLEFIRKRDGSYVVKKGSKVWTSDSNGNYKIAL